MVDKHRDVCYALFMERKSKNWLNKHNENNKKLLVDNCVLNEKTGEINFGNLYACLYIYISNGKSSIKVPYSHLVWFLKYKRWPKEGHEIDHINNIPTDNRSCNLQELTKAQNNCKRKGKSSRKYGTGKYGHGISVRYDKSRRKYKVQRRFPIDLCGRGKILNIHLFECSSLEETERKIKEYIFNLLNIDILEDIFDGLDRSKSI